VKLTLINVKTSVDDNSFLQYLIDYFVSS